MVVLPKDWVEADAGRTCDGGDGHSCEYDAPCDNEEGASEVDESERCKKVTSYLLVNNALRKYF